MPFGGNALHGANSGMGYHGKGISALNAVVGVCNSCRVSKLCVDRSQIVVIVIRSGKVCSGETAEHGTHHLTILWKVQWVAKVLFHIALKDEREGSAVEHSAMVDKEMAKITLGFGSFHNKVRKLGSNRVQDAEDEDNEAENGGG